MKYINNCNMLLEAISYLGRRAGGNTIDNLEAKIEKRNIIITAKLKNKLAALKKLEMILDGKINIDSDKLHQLFGNINGFSFNTIGSNSIAFLIFYHFLIMYDKNLVSILKRINKLPNENIAYNIAETLEISDRYNLFEGIDTYNFMDCILSLSIPDSSKILILNTYRLYYDLSAECSLYIEPVLKILENETELINDICNDFENELNKIGIVNFILETSGINPSDSTKYVLRPFIFGMDTNLTAFADSDSPEITDVFCGILRKELIDALKEAYNPTEDVYNIFKTLGDRTRFDIMCYLSTNQAYGQELSSKLNLSRNTIHHHMNKLIEAKLVSCTILGNKVYYSTSSETIKNFFNEGNKLFNYNS